MFNPVCMCQTWGCDRLKGMSLELVKQMHINCLTLNQQQREQLSTVYVYLNVVV